MACRSSVIRLSISSRSSVGLSASISVALDRRRRSGAAGQETKVALLRRELNQAVEQLAATAKVLQVISSSTFDLQTVLNALVKAGMHLCEADVAAIWRPENGVLKLAATCGMSNEFVEFAKQNPIMPGRGTVSGRVVLEGKTVHLADVLTDPEFTGIGYQSSGKYRSNLGVPLLRKGQTIGAFLVARRDVRPFTEKQIKLVETFADQAVIAIENARLFEAEQQRSRVTELLEQQTATSEVLKVISRSAFDLQPVFDAIAENGVRLCEAERAFIFRFDGEFLRAVGYYNVGLAIREFVDRNPVVPGSHSISARAALERRTVHVPDVQADPDYAYAMRDVDPIRTILAVPMLKGNDLASGDYHHLQTRDQTFYRETDRPYRDLRRPGRHRCREHAAAQRTARIPAAANRHRRRAQSHQPFDIRFAGGARHTGPVGGAPLRGGHGCHRSTEGRNFLQRSELWILPGIRRVPRKSPIWDRPWIRRWARLP